jgi:hypothetical protein
VGETSDAIDAVEHIDASSFSGCFSSALPQETSASMFSFYIALGVNVRYLFLLALREVRAVDD